MDELEPRIRKLERDLAKFAESLQLAFRYIRSDAGSSLTKSRLVLEKLLIEVYVTEMEKEPRKPLLAEMLAENQFTRKIERRILSRMESIRNMGNLGPHGEPVEPCDAERVLDDLCAVLDWYLQRYMRRQAGAAADGAPPPACRRPGGGAGAIWRSAEGRPWGFWPFSCACAPPSRETARARET